MIYRLTLLISVFNFSLPIISQNVTIEQWKQEIDIVDIENMTIKEKRYITIHNEAGKEYSVFKGYEDDFTKLTSLSLVVYDKNGKKVRKYGRGNSTNWNYNASYEIDNSELVLLDPDFQDYPFSVEISSEIKKNNGFLNLPTWIPRNDFNVEIKNASLILRKPIEFKAHYYVENIEGPSISKEQEIEVWKWSLSNLPAVEDEISYKQFFNEQSKVYLSPTEFTLDGNYGSFETWQSFGEWYLALNDNLSYEFSDKTTSFLNSIESENIPEVVDKLYKFMQQKSRYISIQLGIGGYQSLPAEYVDEKSFGDCKALSNYMRTMLHFKGIESNFVLVQAGRKTKDLETNIVSNQFNHVFLAVPNDNDTIFLECTAQLLPTGFIGTFTDDRHVLWIEKGASQLIKMPVMSSEDNVIQTETILKMDKYGNALVELTRLNGGKFFEDIQFFESVNKEQRERFLYDKFNYKDFTINEFNYTKPKGNEHSYQTSYKISVNNLARNTADKLLVPIHSIDNIEDFFSFRKYIQYAQVRRAFTLSDKTIIELPQGNYLYSIPEAKVYLSDYGSYKCEIIDLMDGRIELNRKVVINKGEYFNEDFSAFNNFIDKIKQSDRSKLVFISGT